MRAFIQLALLAVTAFLTLMGCSALDGTARLKDPAIISPIRSKDDPVSVALTSDRRLMVFYPDGKTCPEAPPDTSSNISGSVSAAINAAATAKDAANATLAVTLADQMAMALSHSTPQSQGSIIMRAAFAFACTSARNGMMNEQEYNAFLSAALSAAVALSYAELSLNGGKIGGNGSAASDTLAQGASQGGVDFAAAKAAQAASSATKEAGTKASADAGKAASDAVKATVDGVATPTANSLATSAGTAAHDAVLAKTGNSTKALIAQLTAQNTVTSGLAGASPASTPASRFDLQNAVALAAPFTNLSRSYSQMSDTSSLATEEKTAFQAMLSQDVDSALAALNSVYQASPQYHDIASIRMLVQSRYAQLKAKDQASWKNLYATIVKLYATNAPSDELTRMSQLAQ
ncbi:hypothetical protein [Dyella sp.]|uniref:hypothetical protein n=1 Tax=Dyella sp. TaxID=1869338 RepID=UPI002ED4ACDC